MYQQSNNATFRHLQQVQYVEQYCISGIVHKRKRSWISQILVPLGTFSCIISY